MNGAPRRGGGGGGGVLVSTLGFFVSPSVWEAICLWIHSSWSYVSPLHKVGYIILYINYLGGLDGDFILGRGQA